MAATRTLATSAVTITYYSLPHETLYDTKLSALQSMAKMLSFDLRQPKTNRKRQIKNQT